MEFSIVSDNLALLAIAGGTSAAFLNSATENLLDRLVDKSSAVEIKSILFQAFVSAITIGLLLSIIFYAFALSGFPEKALNPIELIAIFTIFFGLGHPLLGAILKFAYSKFKPEF